MLNEHHRPGLSERALEYPFKIVGRGWQYDFQSWRVGEPVIKSVRMVRSGATHRSHGPPNEYRRFYLSVGHVGNIRRLLDNLSDGFESKIKKDFVHNRASACHSGTNRHAR